MCRFLFACVNKPSYLVATIVPWLVLGLILAKCAVELWLDHLNRWYVLARAGSVPPAFKDIIDERAYAKSVKYTLAKDCLAQVETGYNAVLLPVMLFSGVLPWGWRLFMSWLGPSVWAVAAFLFTTGVVLGLPVLPLEWYHQFRLEERFGFNTTTQKLWWLDRF